MDEQIPADAVNFTCGACGTMTWLTQEEAVRCAGTQMGCRKCGQDIDIPDGSQPAATEKRIEAARSAQQIGLQADTPPSAGISATVLPNPVRNRPAGPVALPELKPLDEESSSRIVLQRNPAPAARKEPAESTAPPGRIQGKRLRLPRRFIRSDEKRKPKKTASEPARQRRKKWKRSDFERWLPSGLVAATLVMFLVVSLCTAPAKMPASTYLMYRLGFVFCLTIVVTVALLAWSAVFGACYGDLATALIKFPTIVVTQAWAEDLLALQPLPYVAVGGACAVALYLFMNLFEVELVDAFVSMCVVRGAHLAAFWMVFVNFLPATSEDDGRVAEAGRDPQAAVKHDEPAGGLRPVAQNGKAKERSSELTQEFGDALVAQDYGRAYRLMSRDYKSQVPMQDFVAIHRRALLEYGRPLKATAGFGEDGAAALKGPEFERFKDVPPDDRVAWTYAQLFLELKEDESGRCYDCWLLLVRNADDLRVGAFEYEPCE